MASAYEGKRDEAQAELFHEEQEVDDAAVLPGEGEMSDLRPCPFCGSDNIDTTEMTPGEWACECCECGCIGPMWKDIEGFVADSQLTQDEAVDKWNTRV